MSGKVSSKIVTDGLVLNLDGANPKSYISGSTTWNDLTYYKNDGTLTNGPTFNPNNGGSIVFDGIDDYINTDFIPVIGTGETSYDVWFKTGTAQTGGIINTRNASAVQFVVVISNEFGSLGSNLFVYSYDGVTQRSVATSETWTDNVWHHVVSVHTSETDVLYVDGVLRVSGTTIPLDISNTTRLLVGVLGDGTSVYSGWYFNGEISNTKVYNRALTPSEVLQNYNALKNRYI
jgi:hypothetical protein